MRIMAVVLFATGLFMVTALSAAQPPGGKGGQQGKGKFPGGKGGFQGGKGAGFGAPMVPGQILAPFVADRLKLTDEQKQQVVALQKEVDEKLAKILNEEQNKQLKDMKERFRGAGRRDGGRGDARPPGRPGLGGDKSAPPPPME